jgi:serine protease Do
MSNRKSSIFYGLLIGFTSLVVGMVIASRLGLSPSSAANPLDVPATNSAPLVGPLDTTTFRAIAHEAGPAVVSITARVPRGNTAAEAQDFFGIPLPPGLGGGGERRPRGLPPEAVQGGSGFIIDKSGYILTNNHVVDKATSIEVFLASMKDGEEGYAAKVVGRDELTDSALIQLIELPKTPLTPARFGDSSQMAPGDWVMAIGNPFGLANTVTVGVVSAVGRENAVATQRYAEFIQTDAAINHGNSGGPLLNVRGEVVGINTMIVSDNPQGGNLGIGFAIPINTVRDLLPQLKEGKVTRGRIAVQIVGRPMSEEYAKELGLPRPGGAEVQSVISGGPADKAGMKAGDVVVEFNGKPITDRNELVAMVTSTRPGTTVPLKVVRDRKTVSLNVTVAELILEEEQRATTGPTGGGSRRATPQDTGLGMGVQELTPSQARQLRIPAGRSGVVVASVEPFSPAANAGLQEGDVILSFQAQSIGTVADLTAAIERLAAGRTARLIIMRPNAEGNGGEELLLQIRKR